MPADRPLARPMTATPAEPATEASELRLRPAHAGDLAWLQALAADATVEPYLAPGAVAGLADALAADELLVAERDGASIGAVRALLVNPRSRIAAIRTLMVDPGTRGRGVGVAMIRAVVRRLVAEHDAHRVEAEVYGFNEAGLRAFTAAGFTCDGTRRRAYARHGDWQDGVLFGYLADEPG